MEDNAYRPHVALRSIDAAIEDCIVSRRNFYLGLWVARQLGIIDGLHRDYARGVVASDYEQPGYEDVLRKLARDFAECGLAFPREEVERQLQHAWTIAFWHFAESD
jgi:hypothetical protein